MTIPMILGMPSQTMRSDEELAVLARVKEITARGNVAVFTRSHRLIGGVTIVKRVTNPVPDELGDLESDNGWVAPWDPAYTLTEEVRKDT